MLFYLILVLVAFLGIFRRRNVVFWTSWCAVALSIILFFPRDIGDQQKQLPQNFKSELTPERAMANDVEAFQVELPLVLDEAVTATLVRSKGETIEFFYEVDFTTLDLAKIANDLREGTLIAACTDPQHYINTVDGFKSHYAFSPNDTDEYTLRIGIQKSDCPQ